MLMTSRMVMDDEGGGRLLSQMLSLEVSGGRQGIPEMTATAGPVALDCKSFQGVLKKIKAMFLKEQRHSSHF